jgi:hypothetical protein
VEPTDFGDRLDSHEAILRSLTAMLVKQDDINGRLTAAIERLEGSLDASMTRMESYMARQDVINERLTAAIERLDATQADIKTLLQRLVQGSGNGREV